MTERYPPTDEERRLIDVELRCSARLGDSLARQARMECSRARCEALEKDSANLRALATRMMEGVPDAG